MINIAANCTCDRITTEAISMHAGNCKVWALHHDLDDERPVTVAVTSEGIIHVGLVTPDTEVDSEATRARITKGAKQWALAHGFTDQMSLVSSGVTFNRERSETRLIFSLMGR